MFSRRALAVASSPEVVRLALRTSLFIGSLLNLINQGDALFGEAPLVPAKLALTYLVPYGVATFSVTSVSLRLAQARASQPLSPPPPAPATTAPCRNCACGS